MGNNAIQGFILSKQQFSHQGKLGLCYWFATDTGPVQVLVDDEKLVFFIENENSSASENLLNEENIKYERKPVKLKTFSLRLLTGFYFTALKDFYQAKDILSINNIKMYEADIRHSDRFLMERFIKGSAWITGNISKFGQYQRLNNAKLVSSEYTPVLSMLSLDIECSGQGILFSIGLYSDNFDLVIMVGEKVEGSVQNICWVKDEIDLLKQLTTELENYDPDVIIGWNVINFDFSLLVKRAEQLGVSLNLGRAASKVIFKDTQVGKLQIPGRVVLDGIDTLKNASYHFSSFSLSSVAHELLGEKKLIDTDDRLAEIERQFAEDKLALAKYNLQDCKLVWDIFKQEKLLEFAVIRSKLTGLDMERMGGSVAAFVNLYLPKLHRSGYVAPNLGDSPVSFESPGGYVMNSTPGLYKNIIVLDFKSLYPSIIRTFYIDPMGLIEGLKAPDKAVSGFKQACFSRTHHHLPQLIEDLWLERDKAKHNDDKMLSQAIKIIMNSFYGVLGSTGCRFYDPRLSSSITLRGHEIMQQTRKWIEAQNYNVIYGDTDSTFIQLPDAFTADECDAVGKKLSADINLQWEILLQAEYQIKSHLEIEFETHYQPFFMPTIRGESTGSKKRYVGQITRTENKKLIFKGMETVRSDWTELARIFQQQLYQKVFAEQEVENYIKEYVSKTLSGDFDNLLIYRKRLRQHLSEYEKNIPPHAQAAIKLQLKKPDKAPKKGAWVEYLITKTGPEIALYTSGEPDRNHYVNKQIKPIADSILPYLNRDFDQILNGQFSLF